MDTALGILVRVATAFTLLFTAAVLAHYLKRKIPEGRLKQILYKRLTR